MRPITTDDVAVVMSLMAFVGAFVAFVAIGFSCYYRKKRTKLYNQIRQSIR